MLCLPISYLTVFARKNVSRLVIAVLPSWVIEIILRNSKRHVKNSKRITTQQVKQYFDKIDAVSSFKQEVIFAIPQALASMEEHVLMHWTRLFVTVRCDTQENIVEVREYHLTLFQFLWY